MALSMPLTAVARGAAAGVLGTAAMTVAQEGWARLQPASPEPEAEAANRDPWEQASVPAKVGKRIGEGIFRREVGPEWIGPLTHAMHWAYGTGWGATYGLLAARPATRPLRRGLQFGTGVWGMAYVQLVPMGLYEPPWRYRPRELAPELAFHLVYGVGVAGAHRLLSAG